MSFNFPSLHGPLISLCGFKSTNHMTQNLSSRAHRNETPSNGKLDRWQTIITAPVVYVLVVDNFEYLGIHFRGQLSKNVSVQRGTYILSWKSIV